MIIYGTCILAIKKKMCVFHNGRFSPFNREFKMFAADLVWWFHREVCHNWLCTNLSLWLLITSSLGCELTKRCGNRQITALWENWFIINPTPTAAGSWWRQVQATGEQPGPATPKEALCQDFTLQPLQPSHCTSVLASTNRTFSMKIKRPGRLGLNVYLKTYTTVQSIQRHILVQQDIALRLCQQKYFHHSSFIWVLNRLPPQKRCCLLFFSTNSKCYVAWYFIHIIYILCKSTESLAWKAKNVLHAKQYKLSCAKAKKKEKAAWNKRIEQYIETVQP